jgi:UDP-N-acetylmuramate: L-alanyl-gamma-D-glutamyl-meso-diaminopimelate ligase
MLHRQSLADTKPSAPEPAQLVTDSAPAMVDRPLDIFLIAIGGTGMAPLACLLKELGHQVRGCDAPLYPPMSDLLAAAGIEPLVGYDPAHLDPPPDLVVVGNAVPRHNPVTAAAVELGFDQISMPQALARFFLADRTPLVAAGTHGKTTTSSLAAWVYTACGADPGYLIGGVPMDLGRSFHAGTGSRFVIEGDEYNAAWFDRGPKFLHYRPETAILTSVEYDHADLYDRPEDLLAAYRRLVEIMPAEGCLIACGDSAEVRRVAAGADCPVIFYGLDPGNDLAPTALEPRGGGTLLTLDDPESGPLEIRLPMAGRHNATNTLAVWAAARRDGLAAVDVAAALERFRGVRRRQEEVGTAHGVTVVDDFAHHPTAVRETLAALAERYHGRRLVAVFEPRSLTAGRKLFHEAYREAFSIADRVLLAPLYHHDRLAPEERPDLATLTAELSATGTPALVGGDAEQLIHRLADEARPGDIVVAMSSGEFGRLPRRLLDRLDRAR